MVLLKLLEVALIILIFYVVVTQLLLPLYTGTKLFPAFRTSAIQADVQLVKEEVEDLKDHVEGLTELQSLAKAKKELEAKIQAIKATEAQPEAATNQTKE